ALPICRLRGRKRDSPISPCYSGGKARSAGIVGGNCSSRCPATTQMQMKWRLLLPGASEPRLTELNPPGLQDGLSNCVTQPEQPEHSCRLQLLHSPITAEQYREKARPLRPRRSCFAPAETHALWRAWVEAPGTAPGSERFIAAALYFHSRQAGIANIGCKS